MSSLKNLKVFIAENKNKLIIIGGVYTLIQLAIGLVNYPYIDDIARRTSGDTMFAEHYARYLSEYASWLVQGDTHLTDMGLTPHFLSGLIMTICSGLLLYLFSDGKKVTYLAVFASILFGSHPWFLELLSFRFDTPYMTLSVLVSLIPFLFYRGNRCLFLLTTVVGVFLMCNSYQGSSGIYLIIFLSLLLQDWLTGSSLISLVWSGILAAVGYILGMGLYLIEMHFNPQLANRGSETSIASLGELPKTIMTNIVGYYHAILEASSPLWNFLFMLVVFLFICYTIIYSRRNRLLTFGVTLAYLYISFIASYGVYLVFSITLASVRPRYSYGFGCLFALILVMLANAVSKQRLSLAPKLVIAATTYYLLSFPFVYASALQEQKEDFTHQTLYLSQSIAPYVTNTRNQVLLNRLFRESPVVLNSTQNYPILKKLVPSNENLYWPNLLWFQTISKLPIEVVAHDLTTVDFTQTVHVVSNAYYDIYIDETNIYVKQR